MVEMNGASTVICHGTHFAHASGKTVTTAIEMNGSTDGFVVIDNVASGYTNSVLNNGTGAQITVLP